MLQLRTRVRDPSKGLGPTARGLPQVPGQADQDPLPRRDRVQGQRVLHHRLQGFRHGFVGQWLRPGPREQARWQVGAQERAQTGINAGVGRVSLEREVHVSNMQDVPDGVPRCWWGDTDDPYRRYHDLEWGRPSADDRRLFEKLTLEGFMSGLSWLTILRKRESFRTAFRDFEPAVLARFGARDIARLLKDEGIVRNRAKIDATINNARRYRELVAEFGSFAAYAWRFAPPPRRRLITREELMRVKF